jgi:hypothetical protein
MLRKVRTRAWVLGLVLLAVVPLGCNVSARKEQHTANQPAADRQIVVLTNPQMNTQSASSAGTNQQAAATAAHVPVVTLENMKDLLTNADAPSLVFLFHSTDETKNDHWKIVEEQMTQFASEAWNYPRGLRFRLLDLSSEDGAQIAAVLLKAQSARIKKQLEQSTAYLFYWPDSNRVTLITVGKSKEEEDIVPLLTADALEAYIWQQVALKPRNAP